MKSGESFPLSSGFLTGNLDPKTYVTKQTRHTSVYSLEFVIVNAL